MNPATYAVVVTYRRGPVELVDITLGTAFGVDRRNLATNAHVVFGIVENPFPVERVVAVQAGTGMVVELTHAIPHPDYTGNPVASPDVGLLRASRDLPEFLPLSTEDDVADLAAGDDVFLSGFPGDVNELFAINPGTTVPQATSLAGSLSALRSFDPSRTVTPDTTDFVQHQIPTTPGTSGSALLRCGKVVAVNNAGTVKLIPVVDEDGNISIDRQAAAANNFGIHVKHLRYLLRAAGAPSFELPPADPDFSGVYTCEGYELDRVGPILTHSFSIIINHDRKVSGFSTWGNATLLLFGGIDRFANIEFTDNGPSEGYTEISYVGYVNLVDATVVGLYLEGSSAIGIWNCLLGQ